MKYFIISDIHGNLEALEAVLAEVRDETLLCLGDVIGYGPDSSACISRIRELNIPCLMGNHDKVQLDPDQLRLFNPMARLSASLTRGNLSREDMDWLQMLPEEVIRDDLYFTHSSPYGASKFYYLLPGETGSPYLILSFTKMAPLDINAAFIGHTHVPGIFTRREDGRISYQPMLPGNVYQLEDNLQHIINCPSTGQPRNGYPEAQYVVFDTLDQTVDLRSVPYNISLTAQKMRDAGIPDELWQRLMNGT